MRYVTTETQTARPSVQTPVSSQQEGGRVRAVIQHQLQSVLKAN